jgi:hypothetical protein
VQYGSSLWSVTSDTIVLHTSCIASLCQSSVHVLGIGQIESNSMTGRNRSLKDSLYCSEQEYRKCHCSNSFFSLLVFTYNPLIEFVLLLLEMLLVGRFNVSSCLYISTVSTIYSNFTIDYY